MTTFTQQEIEFLQKHGNEVGVATALSQLRWGQLSHLFGRFDLQSVSVAFHYTITVILYLLSAYYVFCHYITLDNRAVPNTIFRASKLQ